MRAICVDDERIILEDTVKMCLSMDQIDRVQGFIKSKDALDYLEQNPVDVALLDINMPDMRGIELAKRVKDISPNTDVIFLTGYSQYALEAFSVRASGYLLKPVTKEMLSEELQYVQRQKIKNEANNGMSHIFIRTFGNFDVFVDGKPIGFKQTKCKELLAYLVDRQGSTVTRKEAFSILWENRLYDRSMQKQFDVIIRDLRTTLRNNGITEIFSMSRGTMRVCPETFICDMYRFFEGDVATVNSYRGEYMNTYEWANITESRVTIVQQEDKK